MSRLPWVLIAMVLLSGCSKQEEKSKKKTVTKKVIDAAPPVDASPFADLVLPESLARANPGDTVWAAARNSSGRWSFGVYEVIEAKGDAWKLQSGQVLVAPALFTSPVIPLQLEKDTPVVFHALRMKAGLYQGMERDKVTIQGVANGSMRMYGMAPEKVRAVQLGSYALGTPVAFTKDGKYRSGTIVADGGDQVFVFADGTVQGMRKGEVRLIDHSDPLKKGDSVWCEARTGTPWKEGKIGQAIGAGAAYRVDFPDGRSRVVDWASVVPR